MPLNVKFLRQGVILEAETLGSIKGMLCKIYQEIYIYVYVCNLKIMKFTIQTKVS